MAKAQKKNTLDDQDHVEETFNHVGERLKSIREGNKIDLSAISEELMIRRFYLQAIEDGNFKELPAPVYAIGFIKNYSEFLGLDSTDTVAAFKREAYGAKRKTSPELVFPDPMTTSLIPTKAAIFAGLGFLALALVFGLVFAFPTKEAPSVEIPQAPIEMATQPIVPPEVETPETVETTPLFDGEVSVDISNGADETGKGFLILPETSETASTSATPSVGTPTTAQAVATDPASVQVATTTSGQVSIKALQTSWVEVADGSGNVLLSRILKANEIYNVPAGTGMKMITGNAGGVRVLLDGKELPSLGAVGDVRRNLSLDAADLKKTFNLN